MESDEDTLSEALVALENEKVITAVDVHLGKKKAGDEAKAEGF